MNLRRIGMWAGFAFGAWWLVTEPERAATVVRGAWEVLANAADSLSRFVNALT